MNSIRGRLQRTLTCLAVAVTAALPAAQTAVARVNAVVPGSAGNTIDFELPARAGSQWCVEVVSHPAWITNVAIALPPVSSAVEAQIRFDVVAATSLGERGALVVRIGEDDLAGGPATQVHHAVFLRTAPEAPEDQHDYRIEECCLPSAGAQLSPDGRPRECVLLGAAPNPWCGRTGIRFGLPAGGESVGLRILDVTGRLVQLIRTPELEAGYHQIPWDGRDLDGRWAAPGIYFYEITAGPWSACDRMLRLAR